MGYIQLTQWLPEFEGAMFIAISEYWLITLLTNLCQIEMQFKALVRFPQGASLITLIGSMRNLNFDYFFLEITSMDN